MLQHIQRQTFAETTRTDKEKITVGAFYQRDILWSCPHNNNHQGVYPRNSSCRRAIISYLMILTNSIIYAVLAGIPPHGVHTKITFFLLLSQQLQLLFVWPHKFSPLCSCPQAIVFRNGRRQTSGNRILRSFSWNLLQIIHIWPTFVKSKKRTQASLTSIYVWSAL